MRVSVLALVVAVAWLGVPSGHARAQSGVPGPSRAEQLLALQQERASVSLSGPIATSAIGLGFMGGGVGFGVNAMLYSTNVCEPGESVDCYERSLVRGFAIAAGVLGAVGGSLLAAGLPWLRRRLRRRRQLGHRIHELREPFAFEELRVDVSPRFAGTRATFRF